MATNETIYAVQTTPVGDGLCQLPDGRTVLCSFQDREAALKVTSGLDDVALVWHSELPSTQRQRIKKAMW